jgi:transglutaminase-like putative cysteine protease
MHRLERTPARASMQYLLWTLAILFAAQGSYVSPWITVFSYAMLAWRWMVVERGWRLPGRWLRSLLSIAIFGGVFLTYGTINGAEAGSALLLVMIALKLSEVRRVRDAMLVIVLGYFLVFAGYIYSQGILLSVWLLLAAFALSVTLMVMTRNQESVDTHASTRHAGKLVMQAIPFAIALFLLFPRLPGPLWGVPSAGGDATSGLSDEMTPGSITNLVMSNEIAFRVDFQGEPPPRSERYWRGPVLHLFNGRTWSQGFMQFVESDRYERGGRALTYQVTLEPHEMHWLFALPVAAEHPDDAILSRDYMLMAKRPVNQRRRYTITSYLDSTLSAEITGLEERWALQLPDRFNPRAQELAAQWREETSSDREIVERALRMFREQPFVYTLQPPPLRGNTVDDFLFNTQSGFCEHYASAFTFLMRAAGIPARVVTGYLGGEFNTTSGDFVVRQSDAHAWTEVWYPDSGWVRIDPTGAVAPSRIEMGISGAFGEDETLPDHIRRDATDWAWEIEMRWEAVNAAWNEFFLGYGPEAQQALLALLGLANADWMDLVVLLIAGIVALAVLLTLYLVWLNRPVPPDAARQQLQRLQRGLAQHITPQPGEGPRDFLSRAATTLPAQAELLEDFAADYLAIRYGNKSHDDVDQLQDIARNILRSVRN